MLWIPSLRLMGVGTIVGDQDDILVRPANGVVLQLAWFGLVLELVLAVEPYR